MALGEASGAVAESDQHAVHPPGKVGHAKALPHLLLCLQTFLKMRCYIPVIRAEAEASRASKSLVPHPTQNPIALKYQRTNCTDML